MDEYPRRLTKAEERWVARLGRLLGTMPPNLKGFLAPGSLSFFDREDACLYAVHADERQAGIIESIHGDGIDRIDAGDW